MCYPRLNTFVGVFPSAFVLLLLLSPSFGGRDTAEREVNTVSTPGKSVLYLGETLSSSVRCFGLIDKISKIGVSLGTRLDYSRFGYRMTSSTCCIAVMHVLSTERLRTHEG